MVIEQQISEEAVVIESPVKLEKQPVKKEPVKVQKQPEPKEIFVKPLVPEK